MANILVCDDDREIVDAIEIYLSQDGYKIYKAYDGEQAIQILDKEDIHLLIMDIMMPRLDGIRATLKIREYSSIPIIILSAKSEDTDKILGLMRRRYTTARFADRIAAVRALMPDAFIGIDVIVGFPGETEADFAELLQFVDDVRFETNGRITISRRNEPPESYLLVNGGKVMEDALKRSGKGKRWLLRHLRQAGYPDAEKLFCVEWTPGRGFYIVPLEEPDGRDAAKETLSAD